jgi:serine/threonine protein kinase
MAAEQLRLIDDLCDLYEQSFGTSEQPTLADLLLRVEPAHQGQLLAELLLVDRELSSPGQFECRCVDLATEYPQHEHTIREVLGGAIPAGLSLETERHLQISRPERATGGAQVGSTILYPGGSPIGIPGVEVGALIGSGGMGDVYRAWQHGKPVAIKFLSRRYRHEQTIRDRFYREHETLGRLVHPNIVEVYSVAEDGSCFTMELVEGQNLQEWRSLHAAEITSSTIAGLMFSLAKAVEYANELGVVHRDLKPRNVLITSGAERKWMPKLIDFGVAAVAGAAQLTGTGEAVGSLDYMAPEALAGRTTSPALSVDVYGIGAILYFLLSGRAPYDDQADNVHELLRLLRDPTVRPSPPLGRDTKLDERLQHICLKCLQTVEQRYDSAAEVALEFRRFLDGNPLLASREGWAAKWSRAIRRNCRLLAATSLIALTALWMGWLWLDARTEREQAYRTIDALLESLDSQAELLQSSEILGSPQNHVLCDSIFEAYRRNHLGLDLSRLDEARAKRHLRQLLRVAEVANRIGRVDDADKFLTFAEELMPRVSRVIGSNSDAVQLAAEIAVTRGNNDIDAERLDHAIEVANQALLAYFEWEKWAVPPSRESLVLQAKLHRIAGRAIYMKYRRGPQLFGMVRQTLGELRCRQALTKLDPRDQDLVELADALAFLGLGLYKSPPMDEGRVLEFAEQGWSTSHRVILENALEVLERLQDRESVEAMLCRCRIRNTLGLSIVGTQSSESLRLFQENLQQYKSLREAFPLVMDYQIGVARSLGNLADASASRQEWEAEFAFRQSTCEEYVRARDRFGLQRDLSHDISVHSLRLYYNARYMTNNSAAAASAKNRVAEHVNDEVWRSDDMQGFESVVFLADRLAESEQTPPDPAIMTLFHERVDRMVALLTRNPSNIDALQARFQNCTNVQRFAGERFASVGISFRDSLE